MAQNRPSGMPMPSITHRFGYAAAMPAAMRPARRPAISRPMRPTNSTVRLPAMHAITLWANHESAPTRFEMANHIENSGGWIAVGRACRPSAAPVTLTRSARHHPNGSLKPRPDVSSRDCWW